MIERVYRQFNKSIIAGWLNFSHRVGTACIAKARALRWQFKFACTLLDLTVLKVLSSFLVYGVREVGISAIESSGLVNGHNFVDSFAAMFTNGDI